jgi:hypothetical protein
MICWGSFTLGFATAFIGAVACMLIVYVNLVVKGRWLP